MFAEPAPATQLAAATGGVASSMSDEPWEDDFAKPGAAAGGIETAQSTAGHHTLTNRCRKKRSQLSSNLEPRKVLGTRAVSP